MKHACFNTGPQPLPLGAGLPRRQFVVGLALAAGTPWAVANSPRPEALPWPDAQLVGAGTYRFWGLAVYRAALWARPDFQARAYPDHPLALALEYLRAFSAADIAKRSLTEMRRVGAFSDAQAQAWLTVLQAALPNVDSGDHLLGVHRPGVGAEFWQRGRMRGQVADAEFSALFFGIWLSPATSEPALRAALLAGAPA